MENENNLSFCVPDDIEIGGNMKSYMNDNLKCPVCASELELEVAFDGCGRVFPIGRVK